MREGRWGKGELVMGKRRVTKMAIIRFAALLDVSRRPSII